VQGWRVSEVLGLAWSDIDFKAGTATVRRAAVYVDRVGMQLGPTKTAGSVGIHHLAPGVLRALKRRRDEHGVERAAAAAARQAQSGSSSEPPH
jgi:integrase